MLSFLALILATTAIPVAAAAPTTPRSVAVEVGAVGAISVTWRAPLDDGGDDLEEPVSLVYESRLRTYEDLDGDGVIDRIEVERTETADLETSFARPIPGIYDVIVRAKNSDGNSAWVRRVVTVADAPTAPTAVTLLETGDGEVTVSWQPPASTGGEEIIRYTVTFNGASRSFGPGRRSVVYSDVPAGLQTATVSATNSVGTSPDATATLSTVDPPGTPRNGTADVSGQRVVLTWEPPLDDGGELVDYKVEFSSHSFVAGTTATFDGVAPGDYQPRVRARNSAGESGWYSFGTVSVTTVPTAPRNLRVDVDQHDLLVSWSAPINNGNSPITGYLVDYGDIEEVVTTTSVTRPGVASGEWTVSVTAINAVGAGPATTSSSAWVSRQFEPFDSVGDFVTQMYRDFLHRSPDQGGLQYWTESLEADPAMAPAILDFVNAPEMEPERKIARLYLALFDRAPDQGGFRYWIGQYEAGQSVPTIAQSFVGSPEFLARFGALDNGEFVVLTYNRILARQPDVGGFRYWVAQLDAGMTRGELIARFSEAPEFVSLSKPAADLIVIYSGMLGRTPTQRELRADLQTVTNTNGSLEPIIERLLVGTEYRQRITD